MPDILRPGWLALSVAAHTVRSVELPQGWLDESLQKRLTLRLGQQAPAVVSRTVALLLAGESPVFMRTTMTKPEDAVRWDVVAVTAHRVVRFSATRSSVKEWDWDNPYDEREGVAKDGITTDARVGRLDAATGYALRNVTTQKSRAGFDWNADLTIHFDGDIPLELPSIGTAWTESGDAQELLELLHLLSTRLSMGECQQRHKDDSKDS